MSDWREWENGLHKVLLLLDENSGPRTARWTCSLYQQHELLPWLLVL